MIEVIKHGTKKEIKCNKCGCIFTYEEEDIKRENHQGYFPNPIGDNVYVICPDCNQAVRIDSFKGFNGDLNLG